VATARRRTVGLGATTLAVLVALALGFGAGWFTRTATTTTTTTTSTSTTTTTSSSTTTTTTVATLALCTGGDLSGAVTGSSGAAGTIQTTFEVTNRTATSCSLLGYPTLHLLSAAGNPIATTTVNGQSQFLVPAANRRPALQRLTPGGNATFVAQWSDVPTGAQHTCPTSASVDVYPPSSATPVNVVAQLGPCNAGTVNVSPFFAAT
jgi:hypothetical protein